MKIDKKTVDKIAKLSKLEFNEEEGRLILNDMNNYDPLRIEIVNSNGEMERFNFR